MSLKRKTLWFAVQILHSAIFKRDLSFISAIKINFSKRLNFNLLNIILFLAKLKEGSSIKGFYQVFLYSSKELKNVRNLVLTSLLIAVHLILNLFTIRISSVLHVGFGFLALAIIGMLFGPTVGALCGGLSDIINYVFNSKGEPFFPGFTISAIITGVIYGLMLYNKKITLIRCIMIVILTTVIINILLTTYWLSIMYGNAFLVLLGHRSIKEIIMSPIHVILMYYVLNLIDNIRKKYL